eukprot:scaffold70824_cov60-Phaeocystis_antarctica.AAC.2
MSWLSGPHFSGSAATSVAAGHMCHRAQPWQRCLFLLPPDPAPHLSPFHTAGLPRGLSHDTRAYSRVFHQTGLAFLLLLAGGLLFLRARGKKQVAANGDFDTTSTQNVCP